MPLARATHTMSLVDSHLVVSAASDARVIAKHCRGRGHALSKPPDPRVSSTVVTQVYGGFSPEGAKSDVWALDLTASTPAWKEIDIKAEGPARWYHATIPGTGETRIPTYSTMGHERGHEYRACSLAARFRREVFLSVLCIVVQPVSRA